MLEVMHRLRKRTMTQRCLVCLFLVFFFSHLHALQITVSVVRPPLSTVNCFFWGGNWKMRSSGVNLRVPSRPQSVISQSGDGRSVESHCVVRSSLAVRRECCAPARLAMHKQSRPLLDPPAVHSSFIARAAMQRHENANLFFFLISAAFAFL